MQRVTGKMTRSNGMWGVDTDYPDTIRISQLNADSAEIQALVSEGVAKRLVHDKGVDLTVNNLRDMHRLLSVCFLSFPDSISLQKARRRVVTAACDKLCAQERFLGDNAMSKQARCSTCEASDLQSISKVEADGTRTWGAVCQQGHWTQTVNLPRDFSKDTYGVDVHRHRHIPADSKLRIRGAIQRKDFDWLVQNLPAWKSPGDDLIPNELLKAAPTWLLDEIFAAVNQVMKGGKLPSAWKYAIIKLLEKKAPASLMSNQRPVCCARTVYKLVSYFVTSRMTRMLKTYGVTEATQEGFQSQRSCQRQASRYVDIIEDARRNKKQLYSLYIDWGNAFNSIDQDVLWRAMRLAGFDLDDIDVVAELYRDSSFAVENPFGTTAALPCKCGVKQGDIVSPALFSLAMNILLRQLAQRGGGYVHSSGEHCNVLAFADDLILLSDNAGRMQALVDEVKQFAEWSGMWVNVSKSKITAFDFATRTEPKTAHITYGGSRFSYLPASETYKYLGFHISLTLDWTYHKSCVRDKISETIEQLKDTIYRYGQVEAMVRICVVPLFRYSASLVHWTAGELQALSTQFGIAMKNAWKVSKQCGRAILVASAEAGGWAAPLAESFVMQEQWSLYNQSNNHRDAVARSVKWNLERLMKEHGCSTIKALQMELWLNRCDSTWVERLLSQAASLSIFFA
eukprot:3480089-Rhodomonas_salina.1